MTSIILNVADPRGRACVTSVPVANPNMTGTFRKIMSNLKAVIGFFLLISPRLSTQLDRIFSFNNFYITR